MLRSEFSLAEVGRANIDFDYLKGVYSRDVGGVLRKLAGLNSSSILDIGQNVAGLEVPVDIHGLSTHGLRVFAGAASTKALQLYHSDVDGNINTTSGNLNIRSNNGGRLLVGYASGLTDTIVISPGLLFLPVQKVTGSAPVGVEGGIYYDTTLNKLRVHTGAAYETITSS